MWTHREEAQWVADCRQALRLYCTGVPGGAASVPVTGSAVLILPLWGLLVGLAGAGALLAVRELSLGTMPYESTETLRAADLLGCFAGAAAVVLGVASLTRGWRLVAFTRRGEWPRTAASGGAVLLTLALQVGLLGWLALRGHGSLSVITSQLGAQIAGLWALRSLARDPGAAWRPAPPRVPPWLLLAGTVVAGLVPLVVLIRDDDPRRRMLPYALAAIPAAVAVGVFATGLLGRGRGVGWTSLGPAIEFATLAALAVLVLGA